jgi:hypothetical protein
MMVATSLTFANETEAKLAIPNVGSIKAHITEWNDVREPNGARLHVTFLEAA